MNSIFRQRLLTSTLMIGAAAVVATPAWAQPAQNPAQEVLDNPGDLLSEDEGAIVVTGSRIRRTDLTASSPVAVATAAEIGSSGEVANVENFLNELPQFVPFTTGASNNPGNGLAVVDLRAAGPTRTLVLVDGKRFMPSTLQGIVDLNNIPTPLIERVEVVTGGASAVYGSDALAGVVNFILRDDFEGVEANGHYRITERGDAAIWTTSITVGGNFADGRGNAALLLSYTDREDTFASAREYSRVVALDSTPNAAGTSGGCIPGTLNDFGLGTRAPAGAGVARVPCFVPGGSTGVPGTLFFDIGRVIDADGTPRPFQDPQDRYNFAPPNYLQLPQERWLSTAIASFEIAPAIEAFGRATFAWNKVPRELAPTPVFSTVSINLDNPFVTPQLRAQLAPLDTDGDGIVDTFIGRRMLETGSRASPQETYSFQTVAGLRGELSTDWGYETFYQYGRTTNSSRIEGDVSFDRFQQSLLARRDANGNIVCTDPSGGCVPANIFGPNNISPAAADFISLSAQSQTTVNEQVAGAVINGLLPFSLFTTERVGLAAGVEYRSINGRFDPDEALQNQVLGFNRTSPTAGGFNVKEVFAELSVPIVSDSFIHELRANGAVRYSDYSQENVGGVWTYAGGVEFAPIRDIRFRAQYQRAVRAPNIGELFAGRGNSFPAAVDPCSAASTSQTPAVRDACIRSGVPANQVFNFTPPGGTQVETQIGGNPDLQEETSDTYTAGVVISPRFLPGFNATVDYYNIKIDDAIATFGGGTANILSTCYTILGGDPTSPFCQAIVRRPNATIDFVRGTAANVSSLKFEGVDWQLDYRTSFPFALWAPEMAIAIINRGTRTLESTVMADPLADTVNCVGFYGNRCGNPTPKWRSNTSVSITGGGIGLTVQHRFLAGTADNRQQVFPNSFRMREGTFTAIDRPSSFINDYHIFDASFNFDVADRMEITFGVENLFDRDPPVPGDAADEQNNTYPSLFDPFGRKYYVSTRLRF